MPEYNGANGAGVRFGQRAAIQQGLTKGSATQPRMYGKHARFLFSVIVLVNTLELPAYSAEPRRCLRDGQVVITNVPCELLGNASELNPTPEKHFRRGEPEPRNSNKTMPTPAKTESATSVSQQQANHQRAGSAPRQLIPTLVINLLLPVAVISVLAVWLKRRTRHAAQQGWREPFITTRTKIQAARSPSKLGTPYANVEPVIPTTSPAMSQIPKAAAWSLELIRDLEWKRFEDVCQQYYQHKGIRGETTPLGPDGGIDIRLYQDDTGKATAIVQCKAWGERIVGVNLIRELLGVMTHEKIGKAFFMTSGRYSDDAKATAGANRINLIDGPMLLEMFRRLPPADQEALLVFATEGDYRTPTCPSCGIKMVSKEGRSGKPSFWGCPTYPRCRQTLGMRKS